MKCKQAVKLMDKYLDKRLEPFTLEMFQKHIDECNHCRSVFEVRKEFYALLDPLNEIKAPEGMKDSIMDAVFNLEAPPRPKASTSRRISYPVIRRLGVSMLLTAGIMLFSMFIPPEFGGAINSFAADRTSAITDKTNQLSDTISDFDKNIKLFFKNVNQKFERLKEGQIL